MKLSVHKIAQIINAEVYGDSSIEISGINSFEEAQHTELTFAGDSRYIKKLDRSCAGAVIISRDVENPGEIKTDAALLSVASPKRVFFDLVPLFHPPLRQKPGIHPTAVIGNNVQLGSDITIGAGSVVSDNSVIGDHVHLVANVFIGAFSKIGQKTIIKPNVSIMERCEIGAQCLIHSGSVIGSDGYGFTQDLHSHQKIIHTGIVQVGNNVEIGACNTIDRGTLGKTIIGNGVKTDNLVHIAHNVKIGDNTLIVAQVGIAGSAKLGKNVIVAGKAGISGHLHIGDNAIVGPAAGVHTNVAANEIVSGCPQMPHKIWRKVVSILPRLPDMRKKVVAFEKKIGTLEKKIKSLE